MKKATTIKKRSKRVAKTSPAEATPFVLELGAARAPQRAFDATRVWIFDLDNTLYPGECNLFAQVDKRMTEFIARYLGVPTVYAGHLRKAYYRQFGTTLAGLMRIHNMQPEAFLEFVHDIDLSGLCEHPELTAAIARLPGRKLIFTNGSRAHAERVGAKLGLLHLFEDICDIAACAYVSKPEPEAFDRMVRRHGIQPTEAAMFEDMPHNLEAPHALGMTTVLVRSGGGHPLQVKIRSWTEPPIHVHHVTDDLAGFLGAIPLEHVPTGDERALLSSSSTI